MHASLSGKLLVAMPGIGDPRFERSVIMMCVHTPEQAMGLIVNKPKEDLTLGEVLEHLGLDVDAAVAAHGVLDGGPVQPERGYVLHSEDFEAPDATRPVCAGVRLTATREVLAAIASGTGEPKDAVLALGCSGWGAGQLEHELAQNAWLVAEPDAAIVFGDGHDGKWLRAIQSIGIDPASLSGQAGRA
ncbi:MAG: YqgE/AlgH family protein [Hyphomonadaceae bacterium]|nr:YqgE/AlgH family protein [Hyphomonadaceae bacterium]